MRHNPVPSVVLAAALSACSAQPELLNSERIQRQFGSYGIEVLQQQDGLRRSSLYSIEHGVRVCRTYAVVKFAGPIEPDLASTHAAIVDGQSIGKSFRAAGWEISKMTMHVGSIQLPDSQHPVAALMHLHDAASLGLHVYRLVIHKNAQAFQYATIIESHHPDYMGETELLQLYADDIIAPADAAEIEALVRLVLN